jgi:hypothetical protein
VGPETALRATLSHETRLPGTQGRVADLIKATEALRPLSQVSSMIAMGALPCTGRKEPLSC